MAADEDPNWVVNRLPKSEEETEAALQELYARLGRSGSEVGQLSLATRIGVITNIKQAKMLDRATAEIGSSSTQLAKSLGNLQRALDDRIKQFGDASDAASRALVRWTKWLAFATVVLAALTAVLALEAVQRLGHTFGWW